MKLLAVHDLKAKAYRSIHMTRTLDEALRGFEHACKTPESDFNKFPSDFSLVCIGDFDDTTGEVSALNPLIVGHASDYVQ